METLEMGLCTCTCMSVLLLVYSCWCVHLCGTYFNYSILVYICFMCAIHAWYPIPLIYRAEWEGNVGSETLGRSHVEGTCMYNVLPLHVCALCYHQSEVQGSKVATLLMLIGGRVTSTVTPLVKENYTAALWSDNTGGKVVTEKWKGVGFQFV